MRTAIIWPSLTLFLAHIQKCARMCECCDLHADKRTRNRKKRTFKKQIECSVFPNFGWISSDSWDEHIVNEATKYNSKMFHKIRCVLSRSLALLLFLICTVNFHYDAFCICPFLSSFPFVQLLCNGVSQQHSICMCDVRALSFAACDH